MVSSSANACRGYRQLVFELESCDGRVGVFWRVGVERLQVLPLPDEIFLFENGSHFTQSEAAV